jgi:hypothetical protein
MNVFCEGTAEIRHKGTGVVYDIDSDELSFEAVGSDERPMGVELRYEAVVEHHALGHLSWALWEYPVGVENYRETNVNGHEVVEDFDYGLEHEPNRDWFAYKPPADPYTVYMDSLYQTGDMLADHGNDDGHYLLNRMIFSHQITAMEAYLSDRLLRAVLDNSEAMNRLMAHDKELSQKKFTLAQIAADPDLVTNTVQRHLRSIVYHNLDRVDALYRIAFDVKIIDLIGDAPALFKAIKLRHDCVHRNGFDENGIKLNVFTIEFGQNVASDIMAFVGRVETEMRAKASPPPTVPF